jgi:nicotinate-nucleotide pyrophosphorylase (carboxylating)
VERLRREIELSVAAALAEDRAESDITAKILVPDSVEGMAQIIAREPGVISGQDCCEEVFRQLGGNAEYETLLPDGSRVTEGGIVARIRGAARAILSGERTALNFLCHLSGIATLTAAFVERVEGTGIIILDTRKTTPGLRDLEKRAVVHGGGMNHRRDLASYILVKENHVASAGGMKAALDLLGKHLEQCEIEVSDIEDLLELSKDPPARIMLDNFDPERTRKALGIVNSWKRRPELEISGGITLDNIRERAVEGVDYISVGSLTSSAPSLDLSLLFV